jgi:hypothetical protein
MHDLKRLQSIRDSAYSALKFNVEEFDQSSVEYFISLQEMYAEYVAADDEIELYKALKETSSVPNLLGSSIADHKTNRRSQNAVTAVMRSQVNNLSSAYGKMKDRVKQGMSPSAEVIEMDCTAPKAITNFTVVVEGTVTRYINVQARDQNDADNLALDEFNSLLGPDNACVVGYGE